MIDSHQLIERDRARAEWEDRHPDLLEDPRVKGQFPDEHNTNNREGTTEED